MTIINNQLFHKYILPQPEKYKISVVSMIETEYKKILQRRIIEQNLRQRFNTYEICKKISNLLSVCYCSTVSNFDQMPPKETITSHVSRPKYHGILFVARRDFS